MSGVRAAVWAVLLCGAAAQDSAPPEVDALIAQLDGLPDDVSRDAFLRRPALMELVALADLAAPALARAAEGSPSASIRASAAYALYVNRLHQGRTSPVRTAWTAQLKHPSPLMRTLAAVLSGTEAAHETLASADCKPIHRRLFGDVGPSEGPVDWLPDGHYLRRLRRFIDIARAAPDFEGDRPGWDAVHGAALSPKAELAEGALAVEIHDSRRGHAASREALNLILTEADARPDRLGFLLRIGRTIPDHADGSHPPDAACAEQAAFSRELLDVVRRHIWTSRDPAALTLMIETLPGLEAAPGALDLLGRVAAEHPIAEARLRARGEIQGMKDTEVRQRLIREWLAKPDRVGPSPGPGPSTPEAAPRPPDRPPEAPKDDAPRPRTRGAVALGVVIAAALVSILFRARRTGRS